jgi:hypothetical protein
MSHQSNQRHASAWQEQETLWYRGGLRIIQTFETQMQPTGAICEYLAPAGTIAFSYAPFQEDAAVYLVEGAIDFYSGEAIIHATPGTFLFLPRPVGFRSVVTSVGPARLLTWTTPLGFAQRVTRMGAPGQVFVLAPPPFFAREKVQQLAALLRKIAQFTEGRL